MARVILDVPNDKMQPFLKAILNLGLIVMRSVLILPRGPCFLHETGRFSNTSQEASFSSIGNFSAMNSNTNSFHKKACFIVVLPDAANPGYPNCFYW